MTVCEDERRQWRTEQSVARSRVYEQSDALQRRIAEFVVVVAVNEATGAVLELQ
jgi:hypothetical protein